MASRAGAARHGRCNTFAKTPPQPTKRTALCADTIHFYEQ
jgi:hypothetical protein